MRHFEKPKGRRVFKSIAREGNVVRLRFGCAGEMRHESLLKFKSKREAASAEKRWERVIFASGLSEFVIDDAIPSLVMRIEADEGACVRTDDRRDVFVSFADVKRLGLKQGERVLLGKISKSKSKPKDFMFKSPWRAGTVQKFPKPIKEAPKPHTLPSAMRSKFKKQLGRRLLGTREDENVLYDVKIGDLVLGYYSGIFRIVGIIKGADMNYYVCDAVLDKNLMPAKTLPVDMVADKFCRPVPESFLSGNRAWHLIIDGF